MAFSVAIEQLMSSALQRAFPCYRGTRWTAERVSSRHRSLYRSKLDTVFRFSRIQGVTIPPLHTALDQLSPIPNFTLHFYNMFRRFRCHCFKYTKQKDKYFHRAEFC
jgi:hypothetical protein